MSRLSFNKLAFTVAVICLVALNVVQWRYLLRGYDLVIGFEGSGSSSKYHTDFPLWRQSAPFVSMLVLIVGSFLIFRQSALGLAVVACATVLALILGAWDVWEYGTIGSPTSLWLVLGTLVTFAVAAVLRQSLASPPGA